MKDVPIRWICWYITGYAAAVTGMEYWFYLRLKRPGWIPVVMGFLCFAIFSVQWHRAVTGVRRKHDVDDPAIRNISFFRRFAVDTALRLMILLALFLFVLFAKPADPLRYALHFVIAFFYTVFFGLIPLAIHISVDK